MSSRIVWWGGVAAILAGVLLAVKGGAIILSDADPSFVPLATLLFAFGMVGLHAGLREGGGPLGALGLLLAWATFVASVVNLIGLALPIPTPGDPDAPTLLQITYMVAFLGILLGLLVLGVATLRARVMPAPWLGAPLAVGVLWFPLQGVGFVISDGVGLVLGGLAWAFLGYVLWAQSGAPAQQPSPRVR